jgi:hypothetical protein
MPVYRFECEQCRRGWEQDTPDPESVKCQGCTRLGLASDVAWRAKRSDAKKPGRTSDVRCIVAEHAPADGD